MTTRSNASLALMAILGFGLMQIVAELANALPRTWIGGNVNWDDGGSTFNWNPADEPDTDDEAIFNTANAINLGSANAVQALTMSASSELSLAGFNLTVDGLVQLSGAGTLLFVDGDDATLAADNVTINSGANLEVNQGSISLFQEIGDSVFDINVGGELAGDGTLNFTDGLPAITSLLVNDGAITATGGSFANPLIINASDPNARIDLDGSCESGLVTVDNFQTLGIDMELADAFGGNIHLLINATLDIESPWTLDSGTIYVDSGASFLYSAGAATIVGGALTQTGGSIDIIDLDSALIFEAVFNMNGGNLINNGTVVFDANATIADANFTMPTDTSSFIVHFGATVNVDQAKFNADGNGTATNSIVVRGGGVLDLDLGVGADEELSGTIYLFDGELDVTTPDGNWALDGDGLLTVYDSPGVGISRLSGDRVTVSNPICVLANARLDVNAPITWNAGGSTDVASDALLQLNGLNAVFNGGGAFTGAGTLRINSTSTVQANTTIDVNTFDLDGTSVGALHTINNGVTMTINSPHFDTDGDMDGAILLGGIGARLVVNGPTQWVMKGQLDTNASGIGTATVGGNSRLIIDGAMNVQGDTVLEALVTFGSGATVNIESGDELVVAGGESDSNRNYIEGATINGPGRLTGQGVTDLLGFGVINARVGSLDFLLADDGMLQINGPIESPFYLGTADSDGILNVTNPWNTSVVVGRVEMRGGELTGAMITNDGYIHGNGLISAPVINNSRIIAVGELVVQTAMNDNDWDGATNTGSLEALSIIAEELTSMLEIVDNADFQFSGSVDAKNGEVFANGFALQFQPGSAIALENGAYRSTLSTTIAGTVTVGAGFNSKLELAALQTLNFETTSATTLTGNLELNATSAIIRRDSTFSGGGSLIVLDGSGLYPGRASKADVNLENRGILGPDGEGAGRFDAKSYVQTPSGELQIDIYGTAINQFDRFVIEGAAQLDGTIDIELHSAGQLSLGDMFTILTAPGGVNGTFSHINQTRNLLGPGAFFNVKYNPTSVQVVVVDTLPGDYNRNGNVDAADYTVWRDSLGASVADFAGADGDGNGLINQLDHNLWISHFGDTASGAGTSAAVPEPATIYLLMAFVAVAANGRFAIPSA